MAVKDAVKDEDKVDPENPEELQDVEPDIEGENGAEGAEGADDSTGDGQEDEATEVEIVREGDTQPQPTTPRGFLKRIGKLNGKVGKAQAETAEEKQKREFVEDENRILKLALEQAKGKPGQAPNEPPNPEVFDGGVHDPDYIKATQDYNNKVIQEGIKKGLTEATQQTTVTQAQVAAAQKLETAQTSHYERAAKLGVKDYEETEDKAIEIFGTDNVNHLISNLDKSEVALYFFGKNTDLAHKYAEMFKTQPIKALVEIGGLLKEIKVKPKNEPSPDPDIELEGGSPSNLEAAQRKLNKLRDKVCETGKGMDKVANFKKQCKEKGISVR